AVPYWLAKDGLPLDVIGGISAVANSAHFWKLFWVPLVDLGIQRRIWYAFCTLGTAAMAVVCSVMADPSKHLAAYTALLFALQAFCTTAHAAANGRMANGGERGLHQPAGDAPHHADGPVVPSRGGDRAGADRHRQRGGGVLG